MDEEWACCKFVYALTISKIVPAIRASSPFF